MMRCQGARTLCRLSFPQTGKHSRLASIQTGLRVSLRDARTFSSIPARRSKTAFKYHVAAAFSAKDGVFNGSKDYFNYDPEKHTKRASTSHDKIRIAKKDRPASGQDAFFISNIGHDDTGIAFGIVSGIINQDPCQDGD